MYIYTTRMKNTSTPSGLLQQIADIQHMEPGKLCVTRTAATGAFYNLQCREKGKTRTRYVPREQMEQVRLHTENYQHFQGLVDQYAQQIVERTRTERLAGAKKKTRKQDSSWRKSRKSSN